jgi:DNA-directed RNA polymerase subunit H (RpoH/RPB5)
MEFFNSLPTEFNDTLQKSIDLSLLSDTEYSKILDNFDIKKPTINQISVLFDPIFKKISMGEFLS